VRIIISPYAKKLREKNTPHPKNYPYWKELLPLLSEHEIIQIGVNGEEELVKHCFFGLHSRELVELMSTADLFISVENFLPHLMHYNFKGEKHGIVLFGKSDPEIFGYSENINLLKDKKYLRWDQFGHWESTDYIEEAFVKPEIVVKAVNKLINDNSRTDNYREALINT
jgi:hypothetical protein